MSIIFAAMLLGLAPAPASSDIGCILDSVPPPDRPQLARDTLAASQTPVIDRFNAAIEACVLDRGWSAEEAGTIAGSAVAIILRDDAAATLRRASVPVESVDQWLAGQSEAVRTNPDVEQPVMEALILSLIEKGVSEAVLEAQGETIGVYVGAQIMIERAERGLSLN